MKWPFLALAILIAQIPWVSYAKTIETFSVAGWDATAHADDASGEFSHCVMAANYNSGITLLFSVDRAFTWNIGFLNESWQLAEGDKYQIEMYVDGRGPIYATAEALGREFVWVPIDDNGALFQRFRKGYRLRVIAAGKAFEFNLDGTSRGLASLVECVSRHIAFAGSSNEANPFVAAKPMSPSDNSSDGFRSEATTVLANLLSTAGATGYHIMEKEEVPSDFANNHVVWAGDQYLGTFNVEPSAWEGGAEAIVSAILSRDASNCTGNYASRRGNINPDSSFKDAVAVSACKIGSDTFVGFVSIFPRNRGGYYIVTLITAASGEGQRQVESEASDLRDAAYRFLGQ